MESSEYTNMLHVGRKIERVTTTERNDSIRFGRNLRNNKTSCFKIEQTEKSMMKN